MIWIELDRSLKMPLIHQIFIKLREKILLGELQEGDRLPSSRELAESLNVSRTVILEVYEQLIAEGYLKTKPGSGTFVESGALLNHFQLLNQSDSNTPPPQSLPVQPMKKDYIDFRSGVPALSMFPRKKWAQVAKEVYENIEESLLGYNLPEGCTELRDTLSNYLYKTKGIHCNPNQIIITTGATQAFTILAKLLINPNQEVIIEDPVTKEIREIFIERGAKINPIPVDELGIQTAMLSNIKKSSSFVFVTPSHQFPLGSILPIQRRIQLIQFATKINCFIIEDDYDSEFRYAGSPISSIKGLLPDKVIYVGTFSKILSPGLRIGYMILPNSLIEQAKSLKRYTDYHSPTMEQIILARFIQKGYLEKHILKMRKVYKARRDLLIHCLKKTFKESVKITGHSTGLHLITEFKNIAFSNEMIIHLEHAGVKVYPVQNHTFVTEQHENKLILGYGHLSPTEIEEGIQRLKEGLEVFINK